MGTHSTMRTLAGALLVALVQAGCPARSTGDGDQNAGPANATVCTPGEHRACTCTGGQVGLSVCAGDGRSLGACGGCGVTGSSGAASSQGPGTSSLSGTRSLSNSGTTTSGSGSSASGGTSSAPQVSSSCRGASCAVSRPPMTVTVGASPAQGPAALRVALSAVVAGGSAPLSLAWSLGDGTTATLAAPLHTFLDPGVVEIILTVTDHDGAVAEGRARVTVAPPLPPSINIHPAPQRVFTGATAVTLAGAWAVVGDASLTNMDVTSKLVVDALNSHPGVTATASTADAYFAAQPDVTAHPARVVYLMTAGDPRMVRYFEGTGDALNDYPRLIHNQGFGQGYLLFTHGQRVFDLASTAQGVYYGAQTWVQVMEQVSTSLPATVIVDFPDLERRIHYPVGHENPQDSSDPNPGLAILAQLARLKMNGALFDSGSMGVHIHDVFGPYSAYAKKHFIRPILATAMPLDLECATEGFPVQDEPFTFGQDEMAHGDLATASVLQNGGFELSAPGTVPTGWATSDTGTVQGTWTVSNTQHLTGNQAAVLTSTGHGRPMLYQLMDIPAGSWFLAEFNVKTSNSTGSGGYQFIVYYLNPSGSINYHEAWMTPQDDGNWHKVQMHMSRNTAPNRMQVWIRPESSQAGTLAVDDIKLTRLNAELGNVLLDGGHVFKVSHKVTGRVYTRGVDYSLVVTGGPLTNRASIQQISKRVSIVRTPTGNIAPGQQVLVSYDYLFDQDKSTSRNTNPFMPCTFDHIRETYALVAQGMTQYTSPAWPSLALRESDFDVMLGQDEIRGFNMDSRSMAAGLPNYAAMALSFNQMAATAQEVFPGARVYFWSDMVDINDNGGRPVVPDYQVLWGGQPGLTYPATYLLNPGIELIPWWYDPVDDYGVMRESAGFFNAAGLRVAGGPGADLTNIRYWSAMLKGTDNDFFGHAIFCNNSGVCLSPLTAVVDAFAEYSWHAFSGDVASLEPGFELCNGVDDNHNGSADEGYDLLTNHEHCGACNTPCHIAHALSSCVAAQCHFDGCLVGYSNPNGDLMDGCEAHTP